MVDRIGEDRFANYKKILSEIRLFTACPQLLEPLDDSDDADRPRSTGSDKEADRLISELDEESNDEDLTNEDEEIGKQLDDELTKQLDDELTKQLDSQLSNILVGNGSSLYDSESLVSDKFSSVFSSDDEEDDFDRIVERLQNNDPSTEEGQTSMPTLSTLLTCPPSVSTIEEDPPKPPAQTITADPKKGKVKVEKKVKFAQHQSKIKYTFSEDESLLSLFNKIVKNNFNQNTNSKFNSASSSGRDTLSRPAICPDLPVSLAEPDSVSVDGSINTSMDGSINASTDGSVSGTSSVSGSIHRPVQKKRRQETRKSNKSISSRRRNSPKKSKSEIFTLLSNSTTNSALENLFSSLRSK